MSSSDGDETSSDTTSGGSEDTRGEATTTNPSGPNPTGPTPTGPTPTGPDPSTVTTVTTIGTTTIGVDVDSSDSFDTEWTGDSGIVLDLPPIPEVVCIPPELYGPVLEVHPSGWMAFAGCEPDTVILQEPGEPALISQGEVEAVSATYGMALFGMPGAVATGVDLCCADGMAYCLTVDVQSAELQLNESVAYANELFASLQGGCIGVRFNLVD